MEPLHTDFLSAERSSKEEVKTEKAIIDSLEYVKEIINALADVVLILNKNRQTLFSNKILLQKIGLTNEDLLIGMRPGEILQCIHATETEGGCGTTGSCKYCGAGKAIKTCFELFKIAEYECRITAYDTDKITARDYKVIATPINIKGAIYCILSITDISDEKRRKILEKIFIHDIINISGGLQGMINHISDPDEITTDTDLEIVKSGINYLVEEITSQRDLLAAENNEISIRKDKINSQNFLNEIIGFMKNYSCSERKYISLTKEMKQVEFVTDKVLLKRVLINMLKNALEASESEGLIEIGLEEKNSELLFSVNNSGTISKEIQMQIFQRSFSTKDVRRGLGTYSIKLFTENYLNGKAYFTCDPSSGTTFYVSIPLIR